MAGKSNRRSVQVRTSTMKLAAGLATSLAMVAPAAKAQTSIWALSGAGNWSSPTNWDTAPVPGTTTSMVFNNFLLSGGYTSTNDIGNFTGITSLAFNNQAPTPLSGAGAPNLVVGGGTNTLTFDAAGATIAQSGPGAVNVAHLLALNGGTTTITGGGNGGMEFTGGVSGNGNILINRTGVGYTRFASLTNTFTGNITLQSGVLDVGYLGNSTSLGNAANTLIVNGGDLRLNGTGTISNNITLNTDLNMATSRNGTFAGVISDGSGGPRGINFTSNTANIGVNFSGTSTFSGAVNLLERGNSRTSLNLNGANGAWSNVSAINAFGYSNVVLDNSTAVNTNRINDAAAINLNRATLQVIGNSTTNVAETLGTVNTSGQSTISLLNNATTPQATTLTLGNINRVAGGTLEVYGTNLGANAPGTAGSSNLLVTGGVAGAVGGGGAAGTTNMSILPWVVAQNSNATSGAAGTNATFPAFAVYDAAKGVRPLAASEMNSTSLAVNAATADQNMRPTAVIAGINTDRTVNSLTLSTPSGVTFGASAYGSGKINVASGGVLFNLSGGTAAPSTAQSVIATNLNFGSAQGIVVTQSAEPGNLSNATGGAGVGTLGVPFSVIAGSISGSGGMVKSGNGALLLAGNNTFTGGLTINAGQLAYSSDAALGAPGQPVYLNGGGGGNSSTTGFANTPGLIYAPSIAWSNHGVQDVTVNRPIVLGPAGGSIGVGFNNNGGTTLNNHTVTFAGQISGSGQLQISNGGGNGMIYLSPGNTYTGGTAFQSGGANGAHVSISADSALGTGPVTLSSSGSGGTLQIDGASPVTMNRDILFLQNGTGRIKANTDVILNGGLNMVPYTETGAGAGAVTGTSFIKSGVGTMTVRGDSSMTGNVTVGNASPTIVGTQAQFEHGGTLRLAGNGALASAASYTLTDSTKLVLDSSTVNNNNRLSTGTVNLNGTANLTLIGNAAGTNEVVGTISQGSTGLGVISIEPGAAGASITAQALSRTDSSLLLVRGNNLGSAPGASTANLFVGNNPSYVGNAVYGTAPTQIAVTGGNVLAGVVADTSNTGNGSDFATYSTTTGVTPFTGYTSLATSGVTANIADVTSAQTLTGAATNAGVRIGSGGSIDTNSNVLTLGGTGLTSTILTTGNSSITDTGGAGSIDFGTTRGLIVNNGSLGMGARLTGTGGLTKAGTGTLTLNTSPTLTGQYTVAQGTLLLGSGVTIPTGAASVGSGATLDLGGNNQAFTALNGFGTVAIGNANLTITAGGNIITPNLTGSASSNLIFQAGQSIGSSNPGFAGSVYVTPAPAAATTVTLAASQAAGTGTIFLGDTTSAFAVTLSGGANVPTITNNINLVAPGATAGVVNINGSVFVTHYTGSVTLNRQLTVNAGQNNYFDGVIQDGTTLPVAEGLRWTGGGITLTGANTYSTGTLLSLGTANVNTVLGIGSDSALGTGPITATNGFGLRAEGGARTIANPLTSTAAAANTITFVGMNPLTLSGAANLGTQKVTLASTSTAPLTFSNTFTNTNASGTGGAPSVVKSGGGTIVFAGGGSITNNLTITGGTLLVNGSTPFTVGTGIAVNANGIMGGSGVVTGNVSVAANGILSPGNSPGILTVNGNTTLASNAYFFLDLNGPVAGNGSNDYDRYVANGTVGLAGSNLLLSLGYFPDVANDRFFIVVNDLADAVTGTFAGGLTEGATVSLGSWGVTPVTAQITYIGDLATGTVPGDALYAGGNDIVLYNIVPAPGVAPFLGILGLLSARRRRTR